MKNLLVLFLVCLFCRLSAQMDTIANVELFGRVWGMLKFYHPVIQKNKLNWNNVFVERYGSFKNAKDITDCNLLLKKLIDDTGLIDKSIRPYKYFPKDTTVCNLHFAWIESNNILDEQNKVCLNDLIRFYKPRKNLTIESENIIGYNMNQVTWENPKNYPDEPHCMLAFFSYWNRINYCFAYKNLMDTSWDKTLKEFIPRIRKTSSTRQFYLEMAELITRLNDGHAWCVNKEVYDEIGASMKIPIEYVDGKTMVTFINDSLSIFLGIHPGDEILETNGISVKQRRKELDKYIGGSTASGIDLEKNTRILGIKKYKPFSLKLKDTSNVERVLYFKGDSVFYQRFVHYANLPESKQPFKFVGSDYGYIDAGITTNKIIRKAFRKFRHTKAIIIDNRKYGGGERHLYTRHLTSKNSAYAMYYEADLTYPGVFRKLIFYNNYLRLSYFKRKFKGKVIVLIDEHTGSAMEFSTMCLQATGKIVIIGRNSGGYDGSCQAFFIRPDFGVAYSADAVFYPDGRRTQRIGIIPDIYVSKTYEGTKNGKDEILDRAIQYLKETITN